MELGTDFVKWLDEATKGYDELGHTREGHRRSLLLFADHLRDHPAAARVSQCFLELATDLGDLNAGIVPSTLRPAERPAAGRNPDESRIWFWRAHLALCIEMLVSAGYSKQEACRLIARSGPKLDALISTSRRSRDLTNALAEWHKKFNRSLLDSRLPGVPPDTEADAVFQSNIEVFRSVRDPDLALANVQSQIKNIVSEIGAAPQRV